MARNQKATQKKRQKKNLQRKKKLDKRQPKAVLSQAQMQAQRIMRQQSAPIYQCVTSGDLLDTGMGTVLFSRKLTSGEIATAGFIVDLDTNGIKDAFYSCLPQADFENALSEQTTKSSDLKTVSPSFVRKLLDGAAAHASTLGHPPHPKFTTVKKFLDNIDPAECSDVFTFGQYQQNLQSRKHDKTEAVKAEILPELKQYYRSMFTD